MSYVCMHWSKMARASRCGRSAIYDGDAELCVSCKPNAGMGSFYRSRHEPDLRLQNRRRAAIDDIELGRYRPPSLVTSGNIQARTVSMGRTKRGLSCIRQSGRSPWWPIRCAMPFGTRRDHP